MHNGPICIDIIIIYCLRRINLDNAFPFKADPVEVTQEMCDLNGHMNVLYYNQILSFGIDKFYSVEMTETKKIIYLERKLQELDEFIENIPEVA